MDEKRQYVVGINYDSPDEDKGHYVMERFTTMVELIDEINDIKTNGCTYPQFPKEANPTVAYIFYLKESKEIDCMKMFNEGGNCEIV